MSIDKKSINKRDLTSKLLFKDRIMFEIKLRNINKYNISLLIRIFVEISKFKDLKIVKVSFL
tara:strand:+ start:267 stop:452 length:186 start_codon:yes stop_codon:yes gene_type:complete